GCLSRPRRGAAGAVAAATGCPAARAREAAALLHDGPVWVYEAENALLKAGLPGGSAGARGHHTAYLCCLLEEVIGYGRERAWGAFLCDDLADLRAEVLEAENDLLRLRPRWAPAQAGAGTDAAAGWSKPYGVGGLAKVFDI